MSLYTVAAKKITKLLAIATFFFGIGLFQAPQVYGAIIPGGPANYPYPNYPNGTNDLACVPSVDYYITDLTSNPARTSPQTKTWLRATAINNCNKEITLYKWNFSCTGIDRIGYCGPGYDGFAWYWPEYFLEKVPAKSSKVIYMERLVGDSGTCGSAQIDYAFFHGSWSNPAGPTCLQIFTGNSASANYSLKTTTNKCNPDGTWVNARDASGNIIPNWWKKNGNNCIENACYINGGSRVYFGIAARGENVCLPSNPTMDMNLSAFEDRVNINGCKDSGELSIGSSWPEAVNLSLIVRDATTGVLLKTITPTLVSGNYKFLAVPVGQKISLSVANNAIPSGYSTFTGYDNGGPGRCGSSPALTSNTLFPNIAVGFTQNVSWLRAYDGNVYAKNSYKISIPPNAPGLIDNYLINGLAGGTAITGSGASIITYLTTPPNRTSVNRWEINNYLGGISYFNKLNFNLAYPNVTDWANLQINKSYHYTGNTLPSNYRFNSNLPGLAIVYVSGSLTINGDFKNGRGIPFTNTQGVLIINSDKITINPSNTPGADEIDAVLISNDSIDIVDTNPSNKLIVHGALYARNRLNLPRKLLNNNLDAAINVFFEPIYLTNKNLDFIRPSVSNWRELTPL